MEFRCLPGEPEEAYNEALGKFTADIYQAIGIGRPKVYRFHSPLAAMLALPQIKGVHRSDLLTDFQNALAGEPGVKSGRTVFQALGLPKEEQVSDLFEKAFVGQMGEQCGCKEKTSRALLKSFSPLSGIEWFGAISSGTWIWPFDEFVVASDWPIRSEKDERGRVHGENDAAVEFADSYRVWVWHDTIVPKQVILFPEALAFEHVEKERNLEIRRIMIERIGAGKYLKQAGAVLEDMDTLTLDGSAPRALMRDKLGNKWLVGTDGSTARVYTMAVPERVKTCKEAHEMIAGFDESRLIAEA